MGWWITLGILFLLAILPLGVSVRYNADGPLVKLILGPLKLQVVPGKKKQPKEKKEKQKKEKPQKPKEKKMKQVGAPNPPQADREPEEKKEQGGSILDFLPLVRTLFDFLGDFRRKLRINNLYLKLIMAGGDPCNLAVNYGRAWAAVGNLLPKLEQWFVIRKRDIEVECDFAASGTTVIAHMDISITLGRLLTLVAVYGCRGLKEFIVFRNKRKGGASQ